MRLAYYAGASTAAAAACLLKAFHERPNFYSATVYLSQSNACLLILTNLLLVFACAFMYGFQRLLYGPLRPIEIEQLSEKAWYAVLDTLLAMPSFREDVGGWLLAMFTLLLAGKVWGWIGEGKVDVLEQQPPANPRLFHARLATSLVVSVLFDLWMLDYCIETVLADPRPGMMVIFTFEFGILSVSSSFTFARYLLSLAQISIEKKQMKKAIDDRKDEIRAERAAARQSETSGESGERTQTPSLPAEDSPIEVDENEVDVPGWEDKRRYLFVLEVVIDFIKLLIYIVFFTVSITFNGLPMHIMRDVYMTFASFSKRVADYVAYKKATSDMNTRYPDATTEEIRGDACIVCREGMVAWEQPAPSQGQGQQGDGQAYPAEQQPNAAPTPARRRDEGLRAKKLPCGHILHLRCLKAWLERQQVCPTCRRPVVVATEPTAPGQAGQPGAGAPNAPRQPGQQGQPQAQQRQGRARILNFGPIRIGFLNGPGDQIGNVLRQMQNQQPGAPQGQNAPNPQGGNQQGPNHLGLRVPYADGQQQPGVTNTGVTGASQRGTLSTQTRILEIEQRIMQDAHNLGIEQQQLANLRAMEGEMQRLRMMHAQGPQQFPQPPTAPFGQQFMPPPQPELLQGNTSHQIANGHESLPQGMTLPEGWTVLPLHRAEGMGLPQMQSENSPSQSVDGARHAPVPPSQPSHEAARGPTDDNGSPLFVPTAPTSNGTDQSVAQQQDPQPPSSTDPPSIPQPESEQQKPPWTASGDWSFVDAPNGTQTPHGEAIHSESQQPANGAPPESSTTDAKGKGKAAEVEDVPDSGN